MQDYPGRLIAITHRKTQIYWNRELKPYGVSSSEIPVLLQLYREEGITQDEIAFRQALDKSAVTRILQSLIKKGFIEKQKDENDKRCNRIYLTKTGQALQTPIQAAREKLNALLLKQMDAKDRKEFMRLLTIAADSIQNEKTETEEPHEREKSQKPVR